MYQTHPTLFLLTLFARLSTELLIMYIGTDSSRVEQRDPRPIEALVSPSSPTRLATRVSASPQVSNPTDYTTALGVDGCRPWPRRHSTVEGCEVVFS